MAVVKFNRGFENSEFVYGLLNLLDDVFVPKELVKGTGKPIGFSLHGMKGRGDGLPLRRQRAVLPLKPGDCFFLIGYAY